jgi:hypothetical protein
MILVKRSYSPNKFVVSARKTQAYHLFRSPILTKEELGDLLDGTYMPRAVAINKLGHAS